MPGSPWPRSLPAADNRRAFSVRGCYPRAVFSVSTTFLDPASTDSPDLLALARQGDSDAFGRLCRLHGARLLRQATGLCGDPMLAEDLAQDTLFAAWKSLPRYNGQCRFFTWLCAILLNLHRNVRRQKHPVPLAGLGDSDRESAVRLIDDRPDGGLPPDQTAAIDDRAAFLWRCLEQLPPKHREVIYLRFYVDDSLEGIAAALGCSVGTVKSRLFHAIERLRAMKAAARAELE